MDTQKDVADAVLNKYLGKSKEKGGGHGLAGRGLHALKVPGFKHGGKVRKTGIYKLHKGEQVLTAKQARSHPALNR